MTKSAEKKKDKVAKQSWFHGLKTEFKKIVWPDKRSLVRQTIAVLLIAIFAGVAISCVDFVIQYIIKFIVQ